MLLIGVVAVVISNVMMPVTCGWGDLDFPAVNYQDNRLVLACQSEISVYDAGGSAICMMRSITKSNFAPAFNKVTMSGLDTEMTLFYWDKSRDLVNTVEISVAGSGCNIMGFRSPLSVAPNAIPIESFSKYWAYNNTQNPPSLSKYTFKFAGKDTTTSVVEWTASSDVLTGIGTVTGALTVSDEYVFMYANDPGGSPGCDIFYGLEITKTVGFGNLYNISFDFSCVHIALLPYQERLIFQLDLVVLSTTDVHFCQVTASNGAFQCRTQPIPTWISDQVAITVRKATTFQESAKVASVLTNVVYLQVSDAIYRIDYRTVGDTKASKVYSALPQYSYAGSLTTTNKVKAVTTSGVIYGLQKATGGAGIWSSDGLFDITGNSTPSPTATPLPTATPTEIPANDTDTPEPTTSTPNIQTPGTGPDTLVISIMIVVVGILFLLTAGCGLILYRRRGKHRTLDNAQIPLMPVTEPEINTIHHISWEAFSNAECIAKGNFGNIFKAYFKDSHETVALKENRCGDLEAFRLEMQLLCSFRQKDIIQFYGWTENLSGDVYMVTEFCEYGSLENTCRMKEGMKYFLKLGGISSAISYIHNRGMCHLDVAARNIVIDANKHLKLADMGLMRKVDDKIPKCLPVAWCPPEAFRKQGTPTTCRPEHDIWSYGCVVFEVLTGRHPFCHVQGKGTARLRDITDRIANGEVPLIPYNNHPDVDLLATAYELLMKPCWKYDPNERISLFKIVDLFRALAPNFDNEGNKNVTSLRAAMGINSTVPPQQDTAHSVSSFGGSDALYNYSSQSDTATSGTLPGFESQSASYAIMSEVGEIIGASHSSGHVYSNYYADDVVFVS